MKEKPISIVIRDVKQNIVDVLNESNLPIDISVMILKELYELVYKQAEINYNNDVENYKKESEEK